MAPHAPQERAQLYSLIPKAEHKRFKVLCDNLTSEPSYTTLETKEAHRHDLRAFLDKHPGALAAFNIYAPAFNTSSNCRTKFPIFPENPEDGIGQQDGGSESYTAEGDDETEPVLEENETGSGYAVNEPEPAVLGDGISEREDHVQSEDDSLEELFESEHEIKHVVNPTDFPLERIRNIVNTATILGMQVHLDYGSINYIQIQLKDAGPVDQIFITLEEIFPHLGLTAEDDGQMKINWKGGEDIKIPYIVHYARIRHIPPVGQLALLG